MRVVLLDRTGLLLGYKTVKKLGANQVEVPEDCDLAVGRYRWDPERGAFMPVGKATVGLSEGLRPNAERAIYLGFQAIQEQGFVLPDETQAWMTWFSKTVDAK